MLSNWRKTVLAAASVAVVSPNLFRGALAADGDSQQPAPSAAQTREMADPEYCSQIDPAAIPHDSAEARSYITDAIRACVAERQTQLTRSDRTMRRLSRTSAVGGVGAVVSGFTSQAVGTTNAWVGVGLGPMIADDVQQRRRVAAIRHEFIARLNQLQCRADFLHDEQSYLEGDNDDLETKTQALEQVLARVIPSVDWEAREGTPEGHYTALVNKALPLVEQATLLRVYTSSLADGDHGTERLEAISYNYLAAEFERMRRGTLARPELTFRSILAAPLRTAARVVGGPEDGGVTYNSLVQPEAESFSARYSVAASVTRDEVAALKLRMEAPHYLRVPANRQGDAQELLSAAHALSTDAVELQRYVGQFLEAAMDQNPSSCPTYQAPSNGRPERQPG